ncbi:MAG TPA: histidine phosphatase family protein [Solirubrobacteraceae bacterium]|jgi:probable phosphoglycerate mutase|nr:histidine phosphatase family protein [Solirubrobacteraceae bacterium]
MPAAGQLWLVRHAPTRDNLDGVIMGQRDPEAIVDGLDGAAGLFADVAIAHVVSSDARRAQATARVIAPGRPLRLDERLRERSFGHWEGRAKTELRAAHPEVLTATGAVRLDAEIDGLEPLRAMFARVHVALVDLREIDGNVLVVGHNGSLRAAMVLLGVSDLESAATTSLAHLLPVEADLARLREPASVLG